MDLRQSWGLRHLNSPIHLSLRCWSQHIPVEKFSSVARQGNTFSWKTLIFFRKLDEICTSWGKSKNKRIWKCILLSVFKVTGISSFTNKTLSYPGCIFLGDCMNNMHLHNIPLLSHETLWCRKARCSGSTSLTDNILCPLPFVSCFSLLFYGWHVQIWWSDSLNPRTISINHRHLELSSFLWDDWERWRLLSACQERKSKNGSRAIFFNDLLIGIMQPRQVDFSRRRRKEVAHERKQRGGGKTTGHHN